MLGYGQQAGGTHPTGMHSCYENVGISVVLVNYYTYIGIFLLRLVREKNIFTVRNIEYDRPTEYSNKYD